MIAIDSTYFRDDLYIPNVVAKLGEPAGISTENSARLARYIARYTKEYLQAVLGDLYDNYINNVGDWSAFDAKLSDTTLKLSPVANYIFYPLWKDICVPASGVGSTVKKSEQTFTVSYRDRQIDAWNAMVKMNEVFFDWLLENRDTYETDEYCLNYDGMQRLLMYDNAFGL